MTILFVRKTGIYDSINCLFVEPSRLCIPEEKIKKYLKENPFPKDENYSEKDLLGDLKSDGSWTLLDGIKPETGEYIADMLNELINA